MLQQTITLKSHVPNKGISCHDKFLLWTRRVTEGGLLQGGGKGCYGCVSGLKIKPFQRSIICLCFRHPVFVRGINSKLLFLRPYHGSQRGRTNLILRSSNIPQSNITRLRSYHIQKERAIFFHHSSLLSLFQSSTNAGLFFFSPKAFLSYWAEWKDFSQVLTLNFTTRPVAHLKASCGGNSSSTPSVI